MSKDPKILTGPEVFHKLGFVSHIPLNEDGIGLQVKSMDIAPLTRGEIPEVTIKGYLTESDAKPKKPVYVLLKHGAYLVPGDEYLDSNRKWVKLISGLGMLDRVSGRIQARRQARSTACPMWTFLEVGDTIQAGDEYWTAFPVEYWAPVSDSIGTALSDIHPAAIRRRYVPEPVEAPKKRYRALTLNEIIQRGDSIYSKDWDRYVSCVLTVGSRYNPGIHPSIVREVKTTDYKTSIDIGIENLAMQQKEAPGMPVYYFLNPGDFICPKDEFWDDVIKAWVPYGGHGDNSGKPHENRTYRRKVDPKYQYLHSDLYHCPSVGTPKAEGDECWTYLSGWCRSCNFNGSPILSLLPYRRIARRATNSGLSGVQQDALKRYVTQPTDVDYEKALEATAMSCVTVQPPQPQVYKILTVVEIIQEGDEGLRSCGVWSKTNIAGDPVKGGTYRRLVTDASKETGPLYTFVVEGSVQQAGDEFCVESRPSVRPFVWVSADDVGGREVMAVRRQYPRPKPTGIFPTGEVTMTFQFEPPAFKYPFRFDASPSLAHIATDSSKGPSFTVDMTITPTKSDTHLVNLAAPTTESPVYQILTKDDTLRRGDERLYAQNTWDRTHLAGMKVGDIDGDVVYRRRIEDPNNWTHLTLYQFLKPGDRTQVGDQFYDTFLDTWMPMLPGGFLGTNAAARRRWLPSPLPSYKPKVYKVLERGDRILKGDEFFFDKQWCASNIYVMEGCHTVQDDTLYRRLIADPASDPGPLYRFLDAGSAILAWDEVLIQHKKYSFAGERTWMPVFLATPEEKSKALTVRRLVPFPTVKPKSAPSITSRADYDAGRLKDTKIDKHYEATKTLYPGTAFISKGASDQLIQHKIYADGDCEVSSITNAKEAGLPVDWDVYPPHNFTEAKITRDLVGGSLEAKLLFGRYKETPSQDYWSYGYLAGFAKTDLGKPPVPQVITSHNLRCHLKYREKMPREVVLKTEPVSQFFIMENGPHFYTNGLTLPTT